MLRLRLRTQLLVATVVTISLMMGALLYLVRHRVRTAINAQARASTNASLRAFENVQREREAQLSRIATLLAELPTLKALMSTQHPLTIQDGSEPLWRIAGSDLFLLAGPGGATLGLHVKSEGWQPPEGAVKDAVSRGENSAWWYANGQLYWVFLRPVTVGTGGDAKNLGLLALGYQVDSSVAQQLSSVSFSQIALTVGDRVIASTLPRAQETELRRWIEATGGDPSGENQELALGPIRYEVASIVIHNGPPAPIQCYVLMSLAMANRVVQQLTRTIFILGIAAVIFAAILLSVVARRITHPLESLVAGVKALAGGDYAYSITPRGSTEVAELTKAFAKMRGELLAFQERAITAERIAALERAASSISHDLRHYLAAVVANAEFLYEADALKLNKDEVYEEIKMASKQMTDLLESLRELGREDSVISAVSSSMEKTIRRAIEAVLAHPEFRTRTILVSTSGDASGVFDPQKIERAFFNLILNACEATNGKGKIAVEIQGETDAFEIRVADDGPGIPESIRGALFDPFVSSGKSGGTGLGLTIVNKIIHDHDGSVEVEQTSVAGTVFLVRLPRFSRVRPASPQQVLS